MRNSVHFVQCILDHFHIDFLRIEGPDRINRFGFVSEMSFQIRRTLPYGGCLATFTTFVAFVDLSDKDPGVVIVCRLS